MSVKYDKNASTVPACAPTYAPTSMTNTSPMLSMSVASGLVSEVMRLLLNSFSASAEFIPSNFFISRSVRDSAFTTLIPAMFSCMARTAPSPLACTTAYILTLFFVIITTAVTTKGTHAASTSASRQSSTKENTSPPTSRMGALIPRRMVRATAWLT